jgi:hypothetical protein
MPFYRKEQRENRMAEVLCQTLNARERELEIARERVQQMKIEDMEGIGRKKRTETKRQGPAIPTIAQRFPKAQRGEAKVQRPAIPKVEQLLPEAEKGLAPAIPKIEALSTETHEYDYLHF